MPNDRGFDEYWGPLGANDKDMVELWDNREQIGEDKDLASLSPAVALEPLPAPSHRCAARQVSDFICPIIDADHYSIASFQTKYLHFP